MKLVCTVLLALFVGNALAADAYFCSKTNSYVYIGDSIDTVRQACGPPTNRSSGPVAIKKQAKIMRWTYDFQNNAVLRHADGQPYYRKGLLIIDFIDLKVHRILLRGQDVQGTYFCSPTLPITIGESNLHVRQICGQATLIKHVNETISSNQVNRTVWQYQAPYLPPETLTFDDNKLVDISP